MLLLGPRRSKFFKRELYVAEISLSKRQIKIRISLDETIDPRSVVCSELNLFDEAHTFVENALEEFGSLLLKFSAEIYLKKAGENFLGSLYLKERIIGEKYEEAANAQNACPKEVCFDLLRSFFEHIKKIKSRNAN